MSKLLQRLGDPSRSGVYRVRRPDDLLDAVRGSDLDMARISLAGQGTKDAILKAMADALEFPRWFGGNWDALEDCLTDLSWRRRKGHVLLIDGFVLTDDFGILLDILGSCAEYWSERAVPFFAVLVDTEKALSLAELYRERAS